MSSSDADFLLVDVLQSPKSFSISFAMERSAISLKLFDSSISLDHGVGVVFFPSKYMALFAGSLALPDESPLTTLQSLKQLPL